MVMEDFIKNFAAQWEDTEMDVFVPTCTFRELEEWSSLIGLAILNMMVKKYGVKVSPAEFKLCVTIKDVYDVMTSKR
ncbi:MAG: acyl carrier protein [Paludibacteraceae bacterium]|nr:acyl carrier protein [Paludibacteraceae bacterium]